MSTESEPTTATRRAGVKRRFRLNWAAITTVIVAFIVGAVIGMGIQFQITQMDPYGGVPECTDLIADQGGICHGEPRR